MARKRTPRSHDRMSLARGEWEQICQAPGVSDLLCKWFHGHEAYHPVSQLNE